MGINDTKNAGGAGRRRPQGKAQGTPTLDSLARDLIKIRQEISRLGSSEWVEQKK